MGGRDGGERYDHARTQRALEALRRGDDPVGVRDELAASWRRSLAHGVSSEILAAPHDERALDTDAPLVRTADPVLEQLRSDLAGSPSCVVLADHRGRILRRVTGDPRFDRRLDALLVAPGFDHSERHVGTNGLGTALHDRAMVVVHEREHFHDRLAGLCCAATPVHDPLTGRMLGVLGIMAPARSADAAMTALVRLSGGVIEQRMFERDGDGQRELYRGYLAALRQGRSQVFAVGPDVLRAPPTVMQHLNGLDHDQLWARAVDALAHREEAQVQVALADGDVVGVRLRAFEDRGRLIGALGELRPAEPPRLPPQATGPVLPLREYAGWSVPTRAAAVALRRLAAEPHPVCVAGEAATGKATMVELVAARTHPGRPLLRVCASELTGATNPRAEQVAGHLAAGSPVLLRRADLLTAEARTGFLDATAAARRRGWLALTWRGDPEPLVATGGSGFKVLTLPPLRSRPDDVPKAVSRLLRAHPDGRDVTFTPALLERLRREPWPTNLAGLAAVVDELLACRRGTVIDVGAFDEVFRATVRRRLTPVEWLLRTAIVDALRTYGGNKERAATALGMSRASIYRKIKSLDIDVATAVGE